MPLIANNIIIKSEKTEQVIKQTLLPEPTLDNIEDKPVEQSHILVVNGKEKKVGKHSQYLLDMLTIDEE